MAQPKAQSKVFRIYMILFNGKGECERGFTSYLRSKHIEIDYTIQDCKGDLNTCPLGDFIKEIKEKKPDLVYTWGTPITQIVAGLIGDVDPKKNVMDIPIVSLPIADPVGASLTLKMGEQTGRNLAGVSQMMSVAYQIQALQLYGDFRTVGTIYTPYEQNIVTFIESWRKAAQEQGFKFIALPLPLTREKKIDPDKVLPTLLSLIDQKIDYFYMGPDTAILDYKKLIFDQTLLHKIPTFAVSELTVKSFKPVLGFFSRFFHVGQLGGYKAEQILLRQGNTADLMTFETLKFMSFTINIKAAIADDLPPPVKLLNFAEIMSDDEEEKSTKLSNAIR